LVFTLGEVYNLLIMAGMQLKEGEVTSSIYGLVSLVCQLYILCYYFKVLATRREADANPVTTRIAKRSD